jgi:hypothetical protein
MQALLSLLGAATGAGAMYLLDPQYGQRRRARVRRYAKDHRAAATRLMTVVGSGSAVALAVARRDIIAALAGVAGVVMLARAVPAASPPGGAVRLTPAVRQSRDAAEPPDILSESPVNQLPLMEV